MGTDGTLTEIIEIGIALSAEKNLDRLLSLILNKSMDLSNSDGGSLYLLQEDGLHFKLAYNRSVPITFREVVLPLTPASIAGYAAFSGEPLLLEDAYHIPEGAPYAFNRSFDESHSYRTRSVVAIPMKTHKGESIGVLQLINRKRNIAVRLTSTAAARRDIITFAPDTVRLLEALASLAGVAIENSRLYQAIEALFEGFVQASVKAIEQRDPASSGHALRVSILTLAMAEAVHRASAGPYAAVSFDEATLRELKYAGLLHDFGKVAVREEVLGKAKKLHAGEMERVRWKILYHKKNIQFQAMQRRFRASGAGELPAIDAWEAEELARAEEIRRTVERADEPNVLPEGDFRALQGIRDVPFEPPEGGVQPLLTERELHALSLRKGTLDEVERLEVESHVIHSFNFLCQIPWTQDLSAIPEIAHAHHEKINGRGYPLGLTGTQIPLQAKLMAIADIFDALSACDRPYKKAVPVERALEILKAEAREGLLDPGLVDLFIENRIWEKTMHLRLTAV